MPNQVSGTAGYTFYRVADGVDVKLNDTPIPEAADGARFTQGQLDPNADYSGVFKVAPVDKAGNEGAKVAFTVGAHTLNPTPEQNLMSETDRAAIDNILVRCIAAGAGPGVTAAVTSPKGHYEVSKGEASTGVNLYYRLASQTKSFLAYTIMMALDQGLMGSLDDTIDTYVDGIPNGNLMTLRHMLKMRSGIYDYTSDQTFGLQFSLNPQMAMTVEQIIAKIKAGPLMFSPPDTAYQYTNSNYYILAKAREAVDPAGRSIDKIIADDILLPLGMLNTYMQLGTGGLQSPYSPGYANNFLLALIGIVLRRDVTVQNSSLIWASGAMVSMIPDMVKWGHEMRDGTLISPELHELLRTEFVEYPCVPRYGLAFNGPATFGYGLGRIRVGSFEGIDGSWLGHDSCTLFEPITGTVISVYENFQTSSPHVLASLSTVAYEIAEYLYPGSATQPGYMTGEPAVGGVATRIKKPRTAAAGRVVAPGDFDPITEVYTSGALASVTGQPVPVGLTEGVYVKGIGAGQAGYYGALGVYNQPGGQGGAGGGGFDEILIPKELLGPTFDAEYGVGGTGNGGPGGDTIFTSGDITLTAQGGKNGVGGIATASGIDGLVSHQGASPGADSTGPAGAGGGRGGGSNNTGGMTSGTKGGSSETVTGAAPSGQQPPDAAVLEGGGGGSGGLGEGFYGNATIGPGGKGGKFGGGGGGMGSAWGNGYGAAVGPGNDGGLRLRWV